MENQAELPPVPEFADASKVYTETSQIGDLIVATSMRRKALGIDGASFWLATVLLESGGESAPFVPVANIPHINMLAAHAFHGKLVAALQKLEEQIEQKAKAPLLNEIKQLKAGEESLQFEVKRLKGLLEQAQVKKPKPAPKRSRK